MMLTESPHIRAKWIPHAKRGCALTQFDNYVMAIVMVLFLSLSRSFSNCMYVGVCVGGKEGGKGGG